MGPPQMEEDALRTWCLGLGPPGLPCEHAPRQLVLLRGPETRLSYFHQGDLEEAIRHPGIQPQGAEQVSQQGRTPGSRSLWCFFPGAPCPLPVVFLLLCSLSWPLAAHLRLPLEAPLTACGPPFPNPNPGPSPG